MLVLDRNFRGEISHDIADYPEGIVVVVNKPLRWTSADVIRKIKFAAIRHFGKKNLKVGHAGTLDPLAGGVLLVCIGQACKKTMEFQASDKEYIAGIVFGATTASYDLEKPVDRFFPLEGVTQEAVRSALAGFIGEQMQVAPLFSAKQVDGVRAYEIARRLLERQHSSSGALDGEASDLDTAAEKLIRVARIRIDDCQLLQWSDGSDAPLAGMPQGGETALSGASSRINVAECPPGLPTATVRIACTKGTYIRAFARDLGEHLGSGAFLRSLIRSRSGSFSISDALGVDTVLDYL